MAITASQHLSQLLDEGVLPIVEAARLEGIGISERTGSRYRCEGSRGVRLEAVRIRGRWMTSRQAFRRFLCAAQNEQERTA